MYQGKRCMSRGSGQQKAGVTLDYPQPIVDHKEARLRTLAAYEEARKGA